MAATSGREHLTDAGRQFYDRAAAILRDADDAFGEVARGAETPVGTLTVTAPVGYGQAVVAPALTAFLGRYPGVGVEVKFDDTPLDLIDTDVDVAIRLGRLADNNFQARRLGYFSQMAVCSASLAVRVAEARSTEVLATLPWVGNRLLHQSLEWTFAKEDEREAVTGKPAIMADNTAATYACALAGAGVAVLPDFMVRIDADQGRLVHLFADWALPEQGIYAVYPEARFRSARVRRFIDVLAETEARRTLT